MKKFREIIRWWLSKHWALLFQLFLCLMPVVSVVIIQSIQNPWSKLVSWIMGVSLSLVSFFTHRSLLDTESRRAMCQARAETDAYWIEVLEMERDDLHRTLSPKSPSSYVN